MLSKHAAKYSLPVVVRVSKTRVLKLPTIFSLSGGGGGGGDRNIFVEKEREEEEEEDALEENRNDRIVTFSKFAAAINLLLST